MLLIRNARIRTKLLVLAVTAFVLILTVDMAAISSINNLYASVEQLRSSIAVGSNEITLQLELAETEKDQGIMLLLCLTAFNVLVLGFVSYIIIRSVTAPLHEMTKVSESISKGDIHINIGYRSQDELGALADRFRDMAATQEQLAGCVTEMGRKHDAGEWDFRIHTASLNGVYREIAENANKNSDIIIQMMQDIMINMNDLANGKFDTVVKDYPGHRRQAADAVKALRDNLQSISKETALLAQLGASGNLSQRIEATRFNGDWRRVVESMNAFLDSVARPVQEVSSALAQLSKGDLSVRINGTYQGDFAKLQRDIDQTALSLSVYVEDISKNINQLTGNNYDIRIQREYAGDFSVISDSFNTLAKKLNSTFMEMASAADQLLSGAKQVAGSGMSLSQGVLEQSEAIKRVSADVAICAKQTSEDGVNAEAARKISNSSKHDITISNQKMKELLQAMDEIRKASDNISRIVNTIESIALQTNMLALNAAVEAARAGQHGTGFSVVAEEVRNLATRSKKAVAETTKLLEETINRVNIGTDLANTTAASLEGVVGGIHDISDLMTVIEGSGLIQDAAFKRVTSGLAEISQVVQSNSATSEENASASQEMSSQAEVLQSMIKAVKLKRT